MQACTMGFNPEYSSPEPAPDEIRELGGPALLEFGAPWCGHCKAAGPAVQKALAAYPDLPHIKVHDGKGQPLGRTFGVKRWPTLILLRDGAETERLVRPRESAAIEDALARLLPDAG